MRWRSSGAGKVDKKKEIKRYGKNSREKSKEGRERPRLVGRQSLVK